jgi:hypothetical protein
MGMWAGEPGLARAWAAASSRRVRWSSPGVRALTSGGRPGSGTGDPGAVFLLGDHLVEGGLQIGPHGGDGGLMAEELDGAFELAAVGLQLVRGEGVQGVLRLVYCWGLV